MKTGNSIILKISNKDYYRNGKLRLGSCSCPMKPWHMGRLTTIIADCSELYNSLEEPFEEVKEGSE